MTRRKFLLSTLAVGLGGAGVAAYGRFLEPHWLETNRERIPVFSTEAQIAIRLLHLSDFHASAAVPMNFISDAVDLALSHQPDLVCLTGDFITAAIPNDANAYREILNRLPTAAPTFACLGNHDGGTWLARRGGYTDTGQVGELLAQSGVIPLVNASLDIEVKGHALRIVGLGDLWSGAFMPEGILSTAHSEMPVLVLSHNPDSKERLADYAWDVMLCGHTHGGQIRIPFIGTPFAPVRDHRYVEGLHEWNGRWIHITRGVGNVHGVRVNCRPQVSVLELVGAGA